MEFNIFDEREGAGDGKRTPDFADVNPESLLYLTEASLPLSLDLILIPAPDVSLTFPPRANDLR